jgi:acyl-CoA thioesterase
MNFIDGTQLTPLDATTYRATLEPAWRSMLDIHGGYVASVAARAVELAVNDPARALRSFSVQFIRPAHSGDVTIAIDITRTGRSASFIRAVVAQDERPVLTAAAILGTSRGGLAFAEIPTPPGALSGPPPDSERFIASEPGFHFEQLEFRLEPGLSIFGDHDRAHVGGWIGPLGRTETITLPWLICAADFMPPSMVFRTDRPVQAATVDMAVQVLCSNPGETVGPGGHIYADVNCALSAEGFSVEDGTFWAPTGQLLATSRQVRLAGTQPTGVREQRT